MNNSDATCLALIAPHGIEGVSRTLRRDAIDAPAAAPGNGATVVRARRPVQIVGPVHDHTKSRRRTPLAGLRHLRADSGGVTLHSHPQDRPVKLPSEKGDRVRRRWRMRSPPVH